MRAIELSGSQIAHQDSLLGYGIPDFIKALKTVSLPESENLKPVYIYPNPFSDEFSVKFYSPYKQEIDLFIYDQVGRNICKRTKQITEAGSNDLHISNLSNLKTGDYILKIIGKDFITNIKMIKINN